MDYEDYIDVRMVMAQHIEEIEEQIQHEEKIIERAKAKVVMMLRDKALAINAFDTINKV